MSEKAEIDVAASDEQKLDSMRHSCSHILAQAVLDMFPDAKLGIGPTIETGFYYDFDLPRTLIPEDLKILEDKMKRIIKEKQRFHRVDEPVDKAIEFLEGKGQPYKVELVKDLKAQGEKTVSFYENKDRLDHLKFWDLCEGPHLEHSGQIGAFKLTKIAGAYWRGDEKRPMLQRIYGACFLTKEELKAYLEQQEEAKKRDHKVLGPKLKLFVSSALVGSGLPILAPNGAVVRRELENYLWDLHKHRGYKRVYSPHIAKEALYEQSGHAAKFGDELFRVSGKEEEFILKPMNCPHHMQVYLDNNFSYRDMPIRYFEPAVVYRDEKSGQLGGLTRVRAITQDDGHMFCRMSQITDEVITVCKMINEFYETMGLTDYWVSLSVRGEDRSQYLGDDESWNHAEAALQKAADQVGLPYRRVEGEAAFYGPKLDFMFKDCIGREWQLSTIQCDFNLPMRFELEYTNEEGQKERPVVIHRAFCGSFERFMGLLIEHFGGAFPVWLAPVQVKIIPVADVHNEAASALAAELREFDARVEIDAAHDSLGKRIRNAEMMKIPYMLVVGDKEAEGVDLTVRSYKGKEQFVMKREEFVQQLKREIKERTL